MRLRRVLGGTIDTFHTNPSPLYVSNACDPELYPFPENCQSPNLKAPTLQRGRRGEGSKVNCSFWAETSMTTCVPDVPTADVKQTRLEL